MKKIKFWILLFSSILVLSCTLDNDYLASFSELNCDWEDTMSDIMKDNGELFALNNLYLTGMRVLDDKSVDSTLFLDDDYGFFPALSKKDTTFEVIPYASYSETSTKYDSNIDNAKKLIKKKLQDKEKYNVVELSWKKDSESFKTIALFDKKTGELEYDNMLYNMTTLTRYDGDNLVNMLANTENVYVDVETLVATKTYQVTTSDYSHLKLTCKVYGHWLIHDAYNPDDHYGFWREYIYVHDHINFSTSTYYTNNPSDYGIFHGETEVCQRYSNKYGVRYA